MFFLKPLFFIMKAPILGVRVRGFCGLEDERGYGSTIPRLESSVWAGRPKSQKGPRTHMVYMGVSLA